MIARRANRVLAPTTADLARAGRATAASLSGHQQAEAVLVAPDGLVLLCSVAPEQGEERSGLIALDDAGELRWASLLAAGHGAGRAMVAVPGGYAIAGEVAAGPLALRGRLLRTDAKGRVAASASFGSEGVTGFSALAVLGGGLVAGGMAAGAGWLLAADKALHRRWEHSLVDLAQVRALRSTRDGGLVLAASREPSTTTLGMTTVAAFDAEGAPRWHRSLPASGRAEPAALVALADGGFIVVGHLATEARARACCWVQKLDAGGGPQWQRLLGASDEERRGRAVVALADGGVVVTSDALRQGARAIHVARLDAEGELRWERRYGGGAHAQDVARGTAATADGGLVVVGSTLSAASGKRCAWVLRLAGDGTLRWQRAYAAQLER